MLPHSWHVPASTEYYATVTSPKRYHDRLGEAGIDFAVLYPSMGIALLQLLDDEQRVTHLPPLQRVRRRAVRSRTAIGSPWPR